MGSFLSARSGVGLVRCDRGANDGDGVCALQVGTRQSLVSLALRTAAALGFQIVPYPALPCDVGSGPVVAFASQESRFVALAGRRRRWRKES